MKEKIMRGALTVVPAFIIDRITKAWAIGPMETGALIDGVVGFRYAENTGVAFSFMSGMPWLVNLLSVVLIAVVTGLIFADRSFGRITQAGMWLIVAGGMGNLYDRLTLGYVVDFIEVLFMDFAIFNFADICVCCGAAIAAVGLLFFDNKDKKTAEGA